MSPEKIDRCAALLYRARSGAQLLEQIPVELKPQSLQDAYAIQDRVFEMLGASTAGWFLGCTNPDIQRQLGITHPYAARLRATAVHSGPARLEIPSALPVVLEVEFAFKLGSDLPSRVEPYSVEEVGDAVISVHPAIEVVISYLANWTHQPFLDLVADNGTDGALVYGAGTSTWRDIDIDAVEATLSVDGEWVQSGSGKNIDGGPLTMLVWLANHVSQKGGGLKAGQICNTGSCTSIHYVENNCTATASFSNLGAVTLDLSPSSPTEQQG